MPKYLDKGGLTYFWGKIVAKFSTKSHYHGLSTTTSNGVKTGTWSAGTAPTLGTAFSIKGVDTFTAGTTPPVITAATAVSIPNVTGVGTLPTLGTAFSIPNVSKKTVVLTHTPNTPTSVTVSQGVMTVTAGTASSATTGDSVTLGTAFSVPNVTGVGTLPTLGNAFSVTGIASLTNGTAPSLTTSSYTVPNVTSVGTVPSLTLESITTLTGTNTGSAVEPA